MKRLDAPLGRQDQARLRDAGQQVLRRHPGVRAGDRRVLGRRSAVVIRGHGGPGQRGRVAGRQQPAAADLDRHRAREGLLPQQRHQPRRADPARASPRPRTPASRCCSCSRPTPARASACCSPTSFFGKGVPKATAPGAAIIQFFGGIHEIYFPYVLMKPQPDPRHDRRRHDRRRDQRGLRRRASGRPAAPGSIFAVYASDGQGQHYLGVTLVRSSAPRPSRSSWRRCC